jgi:crotonobetainyl-CoA:carnitine CoA-transferase CaiB-like acyl-CoA transferase
MEPMLEGIKVVELAEWGFVPSAAAVLCDWGAEVIKIEHPERGDPMRGLVSGGLIAPVPGYNYMVEQFNRGKRDLGLDVGKPQGREIFLKLIEQADVFVTSFLEPARQRMQIGYEELSAANPRLIYARGHGQGQRGPDADKAGFDVVSYWSRSGVAHMLTPLNGQFVMQRAAFGDVMTGVTLAGGIAAALFRRSVTGKGGLIDVSLFGTALWNIAPDIIASHMLGKDPREVVGGGDVKVTPNPLVGIYRSSDKRMIMLNMLQSDRYWPAFCRVIERADLIEDPRFATFAARGEHRKDLAEIITLEFGKRPAAELLQRLADNECVFSSAQTALEAAVDVQTDANGYVVDNPDHAGGKLVASPVQYNNGTFEPARGAPEMGQHTEEILQELGYDWENIAELKEHAVVN